MNAATHAKKLLVAVLLAGSVAYPQALSQQAATPALRSPVNLLAGYRVRFVRGIEGGGGQIFKEGGPAIDFNLGGYFGKKALKVSSDKLSWREAQTINNVRFDVAMTKDKLLIVSTQDGDNFSTTVRNSQELAEVLLMAVTLNRSVGYPVPGNTSK